MARSVNMPATKLMILFIPIAARKIPTLIGSIGYFTFAQWNSFCRREFV
jgi:hypothetical protein